MTKKQKEKFENAVHVVRAGGPIRGTWGRGADLFEAMSNAGVKRGNKHPFTYFIFTTNETWDIDDLGTVTWKNNDDLLFYQEHLNGYKPKDDK